MICDWKEVCLLGHFKPKNVFWFFRLSYLSLLPVIGCFSSYAHHVRTPPTLGVTYQPVLRVFPTESFWSQGHLTEDGAPLWDTCTLHIVWGRGTHYIKNHGPIGFIRNYWHVYVIDAILLPYSWAKLIIILGQGVLWAQRDNLKEKEMQLFKEKKPAVSQVSRDAIFVRSISKKNRHKHLKHTCSQRARFLGS